MAVENKFADANVEAGKKGNPALVSGGKNLTITGTFEVAAADDDLSVYRIGRLPANAIPIKCEIYNDALTSGNDFDLGLYNIPGAAGEAAAEAASGSKNLFADALDMSAGAALGSPKDGLKDGPSIDEFGQKLWELLGKAENDKREGYDLALTANTVGSAAGTISYRFEYSLG